MASPVTTKLSRLQLQDNELKITFRVIRRSQHQPRDVPLECTLLRRQIVARSYGLEITDTCWELEHFNRATWVTFRALSGVSITLHTHERRNMQESFSFYQSADIPCERQSYLSVGITVIRIHQKHDILKP